MTPTPWFAKFLCMASPLVGLSAHVVMFHIGWPVHYAYIGAAALGMGITGIAFRGIANRRLPDSQISAAYLIPAISGILIGAFYASILGPFMLFFPKI